MMDRRSLSLVSALEAHCRDAKGVYAVSPASTCRRVLYRLGGVMDRAVRFLLFKQRREEMCLPAVVEVDA